MSAAGRARREHAALIFALCLVATVAYGALYYGFAVLITDEAAGADFSRALLSVAYGGAVVTSGLAAVPVGRLADRVGVRPIMATGPWSPLSDCSDSLPPPRAGKWSPCGGSCSGPRSR
jgi:MFS family permease